MKCKVKCKSDIIDDCFLVSCLVAGYHGFDPACGSLVFSWLISACLIKSAVFIKDLYPSTLLCSTWFTPSISPRRS